MTPLLALLCWSLAWAAPVGWRRDGSGAWPGAEPPLQWSRETSVRWATDLPDWSNASPVPAGDKVCVNMEPTTLACLDAATGKLVWTARNDIVDALPAAEQPAARAAIARRAALEEELKQARTTYSNLLRQARSNGSAELSAQVEAMARRTDEIKTEIEAIPDYSTPADKEMVGWSSPTPATDGKGIYGLYANGVVSGYDLDGTRRWTRWLGWPPEPMLGYQDGHAASPVLIDGVLIAPVGTLTALDPATGAILWQAGPWPHYGAPAGVVVDGVGIVLTPDGRALRARDGKVLREGLANMWYVGPVVDGRNVYFLESRSDAIMRQEGGAQLVAWRLDGVKDGALQASRLWTTRVPSRDAFYTAPVPLEGRLFAVTHEAAVYSIDAATGAVQSPVVLDDLRPTTMYSSPSAAGGHLFLTDFKGVTVVMKPGATLQRVATNRTFPTRASLAFVGKRVYLRTDRSLMALEASP